MRETQFIGLNSRARSYLRRYTVKDTFTLRKNGVIVKEWKEPKIVPGKHKWVGRFNGEGFTLSGFELSSGRKVFEMEQCSPCVEGFMIFTCLVNANGDKIKSTLWTVMEISARW